MAILRTAPRRTEPSSGDGGFIALVTVIIIGALVMVIGINAAFTGQTETLLAGQADQEHFVRSMSQACIDEGLYRLQLDATYAGGTVPLDANSCTLTVTGTGSTRTLVSTAVFLQYTKTISVTASLKTNTAANAKAWHIDSWSETDPP